ncbi:MAG: hypothetical protein IIC66_12975 [candidate division Zixibacteria bacterium]|nr:hypothetical protein [candidate division Zixibacteria bacterium]
MNKTANNINRQRILKQMLFGSDTKKWLNLNRSLKGGGRIHNKCIIRGEIFEMLSEFN